jgi:hypothetical protein
MPGMKMVDKKANPGLAKLPTDVRNKMGYMQKGGKATKKFNVGGMANCGASMKPNGGAKGKK